MTKSEYEAREKTIDLVNELLKGATAEGAYCLGAVCAMAWSGDKEPPPEVMRAAVQMQRVKDAVELCEYHGIIQKPPCPACFRCVVCGKLSTGRMPRDRRHVGDTTARFPRRHKGADGLPCPGNIQEAVWV